MSVSELMSACYFDYIIANQWIVGEDERWRLCYRGRVVATRRLACFNFSAGRRVASSFGSLAATFSQGTKGDMPHQEPHLHFDEHD